MKVNAAFCKGCLLCQSVCPSGAFRLSDRTNAAGVLPVEFDADKGCKACMACVLMCPDAAIEIYEIDEDKTATPGPEALEVAAGA